MQYLPEDKIILPDDTYIEDADDGSFSEEESVIPEFVYDIAELDVS